MDPRGSRGGAASGRRRGSGADCPTERSVPAQALARAFEDQERASLQVAAANEAASRELAAALDDEARVAAERRSAALAAGAPSGDFLSRCRSSPRDDARMPSPRKSAEPVLVAQTSDSIRAAPRGGGPRFPRPPSEYSRGTPRRGRDPALDDGASNAESERRAPQAALESQYAAAARFADAELARALEDDARRGELAAAARRGSRHAAAAAAAAARLPAGYQIDHADGLNRQQRRAHAQLEEAQAIEDEAARRLGRPTRREDAARDARRERDEARARRVEEAELELDALRDEAAADVLDQDVETPAEQIARQRRRFRPTGAEPSHAEAEQALLRAGEAERKAVGRTYPAMKSAFVPARPSSDPDRASPDVSTRRRPPGNFDGVLRGTRPLSAARVAAAASPRFALGRSTRISTARRSLGSAQVRARRRRPGPPRRARGPRAAAAHAGAAGPRRSAVSRR